MSELTTLFQNTADAIRSKTGDTSAMQASQFPAKIQGISVGISQNEADARYLQLAGGTMTGDLKVLESPPSDTSAVSKTYAQGLFANAVSVASAAQQTANAALPKSGGTMTGSLTLSGDPTADLQAATKKYVDEHSGQGGDEKTLIYSGQGSGTITPTVTFRELVLFKSFIFEVTATAGFNLTIDGTTVIDTGYGGTYVYEAIIVSRTLNSVNDYPYCNTLVIKSGSVAIKSVTSTTGAINCALSAGTLKIYGVK